MKMRLLEIVAKKAGISVLAMLTMLFLNGAVEAGIGSVQKKALDSDSILHADGSLERIVDDDATGGNGGDGDNTGTGGNDGEGDDNGTGSNDGNGDDNGTGGNDGDGDDNGTGGNDGDGDNHGSGGNDGDGHDNDHDNDGDDGHHGDDDQEFSYRQGLEISVLEIPYSPGSWS